MFVQTKPGLIAHQRGEIIKTQTVLPFKLESTDERMTSQSGLVLFGEFLQAINLPGLIQRALPRPGSAVGYKAHEFIIPMLLTIHGGGSTLEDTRMIRRDDALKTLLGIEAFPSPDAYGDWLLRSGGKPETRRGIADVQRGTLHRMLKRSPLKEFTLDIDASLIACEKRSAHMSYKGKTGYMPLLGHLAENGAIIMAEFREGNVSPGTRNLEFIKQCVASMPRNKKITAFRADSASYQADVVNFLGEKKLLYAIGGRLDISVKTRINELSESAWRPYQNGHITEIVHCMNHTREAFRLIMIRRPVQPCLPGQEADFDPYERYHAIATNRPEKAEQVVAWYNLRGDTSENRIRDLKGGFHMDSMPCGTFEANSMYFAIGALAYNLHLFFRDAALPTEWKHCRIQTVRWRFYQVAGKVVTHARNMILKISEWALELFQEVRLRCRELVRT